MPPQERHTARRHRRYKRIAVRLADQLLRETEAAGDFVGTPDFTTRTHERILTVLESSSQTLTDATFGLMKTTDARAPDSSRVYDTRLSC